MEDIRELVGQMICCGFEGTRADADILELIREEHVGGVILFARNVEEPGQLAQLLNDCGSAAQGPPLLMAVDQEGPTRFNRMGPPFTQFPWQGEMGGLRDPGLMQEMGRILARELAAVGFNFDLAPVMDLNTNPRSPIINKRAFSSDPMVVSEMGRAFIQGLQGEGLAACAKHFPGHGHASTDSHEELPVVSLGLARMRQVELVPFRAAVAAGVAAIMSAHVVYPALDGRYPSTLSPHWIRGMLRQEMGYEGLVVTDDLEMKAIAMNWSFDEAVLRAVNAGADLLLICHKTSLQRRALTILTRAVASGAVSRERVEGSFNRILALKRRFLGRFQPVDPGKVLDVVGCAAHQQKADGIRKLVEQPRP